MSRLVVVTGANRGFGRALALAAAQRWPQATLLLSHRASSAGMDETEKLVREASGEARVVRWELDLTQGAKEIEANTSGELAKALAEGYEQVVFVHNAGSLGMMQKGAAVGAEEVAQNVHVNVTACAVVQNALLKAAEAAQVQLTVVNVSSLCAVKAFTGFELYCTGKAARDMLLQVAAEDYKQFKFLNYAPGPMDTDMAKEIRESHHDKGIRDVYQGFHDNNSAVDPWESARIAMWMVHDGKFESGSHHDYYDVKDEQLAAMSAAA